MGTLVCFHAHPDDESIQTGGTMALAAAAGNRVVLVVATGGEHGETPDDLGPGETLADRRRVETDRSAVELGIHRVVFLGYEDSGMTGWDQNGHHASFHQAPLDEAAQRLAAILREEQADTLTCYDWHGGYGHPDHIKVHHVGHRAAELAGTPHVYEGTMNRDAIKRQMAAARAAGVSFGPQQDPADAGADSGEGEEFDVDQTDDGTPFGMPEADLTTAVDVTSVIDAKRRSMTAHRSQITDSSFFLTMPPEMFATAFGTEWFIRKGAPAGIHEDWLAGLER
jgi:LmbE family N-acetylglucosaminyl deacetylase